MLNTRMHTKCKKRKHKTHIHRHTNNNLTQNTETKKEGERPPVTLQCSDHKTHKNNFQSPIFNPIFITLLFFLSYGYSIPIKSFLFLYRYRSFGGNNKIHYTVTKSAHALVESVHREFICLRCLSGSLSNQPLQRWYKMRGFFPKDSQLVAI